MIHVTVTGKKGAVPRLLRDAVQAKLDAVEAPTPDQRDGLVLGRELANKLVARAPRGGEVCVQILHDDGLDGGWSRSVFVDVVPPGEA